MSGHNHAHCSNRCVYEHRDGRIYCDHDGPLPRPREHARRAKAYADARNGRVLYLTPDGFAWGAEGGFAPQFVPWHALS